MVKITISGGQPVSVKWHLGMNAQQALEEAYSKVEFGVIYYGNYLGYMVVIINKIYDNPDSKKYWEFLHNNKSSTKGIDSTILNDKDSISFNNVKYDEKIHKGTLLEIKHHKATQI